MFSKAKNIDTAFKQTRFYCFTISLLTLAASVLICWKCLSEASRAHSRIWVLIGGKAYQAQAESREDNIAIEARAHVGSFHSYFFTLDPDEKVIEGNIKKALYLADGSAKTVYDNLEEQGYYRGIISGNVSQRITIDSVQVDEGVYPYPFRCYGKLEITRTSSVTLRNIITEGVIRSTSRSDNNNHGMLIEKWRILDNTDISTEQR